MSEWGITRELQEYAVSALLSQESSNGCEPRKPRPYHGLVSAATAATAEQLGFDLSNIRFLADRRATRRSVN